MDQLAAVARDDPPHARAGETSGATQGQDWRLREVQRGVSYKRSGRLSRSGYSLILIAPRKPGAKHSDRSVFKSALTGVAGLSCSHLECPAARPARQQSQVGLTPHIICPDLSASSREKSSPKRNR